MAAPRSHPPLEHIDLTCHNFATPIKRINDESGVNHFLSSPAYRLITSFILHLNASVSPLDQETNVLQSPADYTLISPKISVSSEVQGIIDLINTLEVFITQAPPDPGPRRFGNVACRKWHSLVEEALSRVDGGLLDKHLPTNITSLSTPPGGISAKEELLPYLLGSFGSPQRLDYGTGHELSFAAFLCGIWVLGGFKPGRDEAALTLKCFGAYFLLVRKLILTYTLEPAGSHGVWGLDDHSFLPYIFGSAELTTYLPTSDTSPMNPPVQGGVEGLGDVPEPTDIIKNQVVERERLRNLYFGAVGFINDVKTGPFWEHSPILFDISGVKGGWGKINKGMLKMYSAEVLSKFPVVQHFPFGSIFSWGTPSTNIPTTRLHSSSAQTKDFRGKVVRDSPATTAPWGNRTPASMTDSTTRAPWAKPSPNVSSELRSPSPSAAENIMTENSRKQHIITSSPLPEPQTPTNSTSVGIHSVHLSSVGQLDGESTKVPWATGKDEGNSTALMQQATEANLGPRRTSSPDSRLAESLDVEEAEKRRGSLGTGGVRVAETGDLKRRPPSVRSRIS